jgi:uncharacterized protein (DUF697 family)
MSDSYRVTTLDNLGKYQDTIFEHALAAAGTGRTIGAFIPGVDTFAVSAIWMSMIYKISEHLENKADEAAAQKFVITLLQGAGSYIVGSVVLRYALMATGIGIIGGAVLNALLNFLYTARLGIFVAELYDQPGFTMEHSLSTIHSVQKLFLQCLQ